MFRVFSCLTNEHDLRLVVVAGIVCFLAGLTAVNLFHRSRETHGRPQFIWILIAGVASGCGIWATHFIAMLAYEPAVPVGYEVWRTALSLVIAATGTFVGLGFAATSKKRWAAAFGGVIIAAGLATMHYLGMSAMQLPGRISWSHDLVIGSIVLAILFAVSALEIAVRRSDSSGKLLSALLLTLMTVSHHFTGMGAIEIVFDPTQTIGTTALSPTYLAITVASSAIAILGISLIGVSADQHLAVRAQAFGQTINKLTLESELLDSAIENMSQGLVMFDASARLLVCNDRYLEIYGISREMLQPGCTIRDILALRAETGSLLIDPETYLDDILSTAQRGITRQLTVETRGGRIISILHRPMLDGGWVATHEDITERKRAQERIEHLARHDLLTDLPNRAAFNQRLARALDEARTRGSSFAIISLDIDRFKEINDVLGPSVGDTLLNELSRRLQEAAGNHCIARVGGDEFCVIVEGGMQPAAAASIAERLLGATVGEFTIEGRQLQVGLSIGIAICPTDGADAATLLGNADAALHRAKLENRGSFRFYEAEMDAQLRDRRALQHELQTAVAHGQFVLNYQPQARIGKEIIGFEALVRWQHPSRGSIFPGAFIPLAEESGHIITLGEWILREACREAATWPEHLHIAVNLSPVQFRHGDLPGLVHSILLETGLSPNRLELEITEGVLVDDFSRGVALLRRLKALGVRIALDDFGTGYSSMSYLQSFPFDKIKIDQTFISNIERNPQSAAIVRGVIGLARGLNLPVLAEGVETSEQLAFLSKELCDEVQGYYIGRPALIENYAHLIERPARPPVRSNARSAYAH
ncbi:MAG TPA: EAL domain-containing protein [Xanthobacteraceae bacterium]|nr:EAL domain-containing protein [Xanthobacteraceae bacterium]